MSQTRGRVSALENSQESETKESLDSLHRIVKQLVNQIKRLERRAALRDQRIAKMEQHMKVIEQRMDRFENKLEKLEERMLGLETEMRHVHVSLDSRITGLHAALTSHTRWMLGLMGSLLLTFVTFSGGIFVKLFLGT